MCERIVRAAWHSLTRLSIFVGLCLDAFAMCLPLDTVWFALSEAFINILELLQEVGKEGSKPKGQPFSTEKALLILFTGNFIGILCARSLHFQFYCWYFHTLPFLLWQVSSHSLIRSSRCISLFHFPQKPSSLSASHWQTSKKCHSLCHSFVSMDDDLQMSSDCPDPFVSVKFTT